MQSGCMSNLMLQSTHQWQSDPYQSAMDQLYMQQNTQSIVQQRDLLHQPNFSAFWINKRGINADYRDTNKINKIWIHTDKNRENRLVISSINFFNQTERKQYSLQEKRACDEYELNATLHIIPKEGPMPEVRSDTGIPLELEAVTVNEKRKAFTVDNPPYWFHRVIKFPSTNFKKDSTQDMIILIEIKVTNCELQQVTTYECLSPIFYFRPKHPKKYNDTIKKTLVNVAVTSASGFGIGAKRKRQRESNYNCSNKVRNVNNNISNLQTTNFQANHYQTNHYQTSEYQTNDFQTNDYQTNDYYFNTDANNNNAIMNIAPTNANNAMSSNVMFAANTSPIDNGSLVLSPQYTTSESSSPVHFRSATSSPLSNPMDTPSLSSQPVWEPSVSSFASATGGLSQKIQGIGHSDSKAVERGNCTIELHKDCESYIPDYSTVGPDEHYVCDYCGCSPFLHKEINMFGEDETLTAGNENFGFENNGSFWRNADTDNLGYNILFPLLYNDFVPSQVDVITAPLLHTLAEHAQDEAIEIIVQEAPFLLQVLDVNGNTPLDLATNESTIELLKRYSAPTSAELDTTSSKILFNLEQMKFCTDICNTFYHQQKLDCLPHRMLGSNSVAKKLAFQIFSSSPSSGTIANANGETLAEVIEKLHSEQADQQAPTTSTIVSNNKLALKGKKLGTNQVSLIASHLSNSSQLTHLDISGNLFSPADIKRLCSVMCASGTNIKDINLSCCEIDANAAVVITKLIKNQKSLTSINLSSCGIGNVELGILQQSLHNNSHLLALNLCSNDIEDAGALQLTKALANNDCLTSLPLACNDLSNNCIEQLVKAFADHPSINSINLSGNNLNDEGVVSIVRVLQKHKNSGISSLNISMMDFREKAVCAIENFLLTNTTITHLNVLEAPLQASGCAKLANALNRNVSLLQLDIGKDIGGAMDLQQSIKANVQLAEFFASKSTAKKVSITNCGLSVFKVKLLLNFLAKNNPAVEILDFTNARLTMLPNVENLPHLKEIILASNPTQKLPICLGRMTTLSVSGLTDYSNLTFPKEAMDMVQKTQGAKSAVAPETAVTGLRGAKLIYRHMLENNEAMQFVKLIALGDANSGKTTIINRLKKWQGNTFKLLLSNFFDLKPHEVSPQGIPRNANIENIVVDKQVNVSIYELGTELKGRQLFLSTANAIILLVVNLTEQRSQIEAQISNQISFISRIKASIDNKLSSNTNTSINKLPIYLIGTKGDQITKEQLALRKQILHNWMKATLPNVQIEKTFVCNNKLNKQFFKELEQQIMKISNIKLPLYYSSIAKCIHERQQQLKATDLMNIPAFEDASGLIEQICPGLSQQEQQLTLLELHNRGVLLYDLFNSTASICPMLAFSKLSPSIKLQYSKKAMPSPTLPVNSATTSTSAKFTTKSKAKFVQPKKEEATF